MRSKHVTQTVIILELTFIEANWLRNVMQKPLCLTHVPAVEQEQAEDREMRIRFFDAVSREVPK